MCPGVLIDKFIPSPTCFFIGAISKLVAFLPKIVSTPVAICLMDLDGEETSASTGKMNKSSSLSSLVPSSPLSLFHLKRKRTKLSIVLFVFNLRLNESCEQWQQLGSVRKTNLLLHSASKHPASSQPHLIDCSIKSHSQYIPTPHSCASSTSNPIPIPIPSKCLRTTKYAFTKHSATSHGRYLRRAAKSGIIGSDYEQQNGAIVDTNLLVNTDESASCMIE